VTKTFPIAALVLLLSIPFSTDSFAQQPQPQPTPSAERPATPVSQRPVTPLDIEVVISRFQGDKKISSLPYSFSVNANGPETSLNMGTEVPVPNNVFAGGDKPGAPLRSFNYRSVGTSITASATSTADARFELRLWIDDSSVYTSADNKQNDPILAEMPVFRNFKSRNNLLLRDGQTRQYTAATDRVSGEVVKVDVTLRIVK
jgi:hypothetical protein